MFLQLLFFISFSQKKKKKKKKKKHTRALAWVNTQMLCHNSPTIYLFSWEREGNPYTSNPFKNFKILQSALSDQPLQRTSLDLQFCKISCIFSVNFAPFQ